MNRRHFISTVGISAAGGFAMPSFARSSTATTGDVALIREILSTLHPGLYRYASPRQIDAELNALDRDWSGLDRNGRFLSLARLLASLKCGHSYPNFFNQTAKIKKALFDPDEPFRLPFRFCWIGDQMVVTQNQSKDALLPVGSIVKAIDGVKPRTILKRLLPFVRADGNNDGKRRALLSTTGSQEIETFDAFYGLLYGAPKSGAFNIDYHAPNSSLNAQTVMAPLTWGERKASNNQIENRRSDQPIWDWEMRPDGVAILSMDSWSMFNSTWKWEDWLNERLDSLKGAKGLILDIRENEGGNDCGDVILARLTGKDIVKPQGKRLVRYKQVPAPLNRYLDTWDDSFRDWGETVRPYNDRYFEQVGQMADPVIRAKSSRIDVPMAVLIGPQNSSAAFQFANVVRATNLGTLIGETTGGNQRGINGGAFFFVRLPESGLEFDLPLIGYFPDGPTPPDAGLRPDIETAPSAADIANGHDRQMSLAIRKLLHG